jgi:hypothetical protein
VEYRTSRSESHRRVQIAKTSIKSFCLRHLANHRLRCGPCRRLLFWLDAPGLVCCYFPEVRCPAHAPQGTQLLLRLPPNVIISCFGRANPLVALTPVPKSPVQRLFYARLLSIDYFWPSVKHSTSGSGSHRRVELAKTSTKSFCLRHLANHRLRYGPRRLFIYGSTYPNFFARLLLHPLGPLSRAYLTGGSSVVAASSKRCEHVFWPVSTRW